MYVPRSRKKLYLYGFACSQSQQAFFDFIPHAIGPLLQLQLQTVCDGKIMHMYLMELAVQQADMPPKKTKNKFR